MKYKVLISARLCNILTLHSSAFLLHFSEHGLQIPSCPINPRRQRSQERPLNK